MTCSSVGGGGLGEQKKKNYNDLSAKNVILTMRVISWN